jgi:hypothetical protein
MLSRVAIAFALLMVAADLSSAQESRGTILGRVVDASAAVVPEASVRAVNVETNTGASTKTNGEGNFELPYLLTGTYRLEVKRAGFKEFIRTPLELRAAERMAVNVTLEVGDVAEIMNVTAESPLLDTATASIGSVIDRQINAVMPQTDYYVVLLAPGIVNLQQPGILISPGWCSTSARGRSWIGSSSSTGATARRLS